MHYRFTAPLWMRWLVLVLGALMVAPTLAAGPDIPAPFDQQGKDQGQELVALNTGTSHQLIPRKLTWWPYSTGPYYSSAKDEGLTGEDVLITRVGRFKTTQKLNLPAELLANSANLVRGGKHYFIGQLSPAAYSQQAPRALLSMGAEIVGELATNAMILRMDKKAYDLVSTSSLLQFLEPYHPAFKIDPAIGDGYALTPEEAAKPTIKLLVEFFPGELTGDLNQLVVKTGGQILTPVDVAQPLTGATIEVEVLPQWIPTIAQLEGVESIIESRPMSLMGERGSLYLQSENAALGDYVYWKVGLQGDGQVVHVADSGLSPDAMDHANTRTDAGWVGGSPNGPNVIANHRKIVSYMQASRFGGAGDLSACDAVKNGASTHGQLVTSIALGNATRGVVPAPSNPSPTDDGATNPNHTWVTPFGNGFYIDANSDGQFRELNDSAFDGVAKGARVVFVDCKAGCPDSSGITAGNMQQQVETTWTDPTLRANIHNFSFGSDAPSSGPTYNNATDKAVSNYPINLVIWSAGNAGPLDSRSGYSDGKGNISNEASCKNCISAGGSQGVNGQVWGNTSEGPGPAGRHVVTVLAEAIDTACRSITTEELQNGSPTCASSGFQQGTSFSAPNLAGAAAVIREYFAAGFYPDGTDKNPQNNADKIKNISGRLIRAMFIAGSKPMPLGKGSLPVFHRLNHAWGMGQFFLTRVLPLADFSGQTIRGLVVVDPSVDLDQDGTVDGITSLSLTNPLAAINDTTTAEFQVLDTDQNLSVGLAWDDPGTGGNIVHKVTMELKFCGWNGDCNSTDPANGVVSFQGNNFTEDINEDGTLGTNEVDIDGDGKITGWFYSISDQDITNASGTPANYRDTIDNYEGIFVPTKVNAQDLDRNGVPDLQFLDAISGSKEGVPCTLASPCKRTGKWQIKLTKRTGPLPTPYALAIAGSVTAGSAVRFERNPVTCNGFERVIVSERADATDPACPDATCTAATVSGRTTIKVCKKNDPDCLTPVDVLTNIPFTKISEYQFRTGDIPVSSVGTPNTSDQIMTVTDIAAEDTNPNILKVFYNDQKGPDLIQRVSQAAVDCKPNIDVFVISQLGPDSPFALAGGCDNDRYLDAGETFALTAQFFNLDPVTLIDANIRLKACLPTPGPNVTTCTPSPLISIDDPVHAIGVLPARTAQWTTFPLRVVGTPTPRTRLELHLCLWSDKAGMPNEGCTKFQVLLQADDEKHYYITDCPTGCTMDYDRNNDEVFEDYVQPNPYDNLDIVRRDLPEKNVVFENMTDTSHGFGNPGFSRGWDFDLSDQGFTTGVVPADKSPATVEPANWGEDKNWNNVLDSGEDRDPVDGKLNQGWGTGGGCGWMSSNTAGSPGGVWHTGIVGAWLPEHDSVLCASGGTLRWNDNVCETIETNGDGALLESQTKIWFESLHTPEIRPVHFGDDPDGFGWRTQILDWSYNLQMDFGDGRTGLYWDFDLNLDDNTDQLGDTVLGGEIIDTYSSGTKTGLLSGNVKLYGGAFAFAPNAPKSDTAHYGDAANGTIGSNRTGKRGCIFNNLDIEGVNADGPGLTAAERAVLTPKPSDDDCDNDINLGPDGAPGLAGVDDDNDGIIDEQDEACPCRVCSTGSPRAGQPCTNDAFCNPINYTTPIPYRCVSNTDAAGKPNKFGDDICGDGTVDEGVNARFFGSGVTNRQIRNYDLNFWNGVAGAGIPTGNIRYQTLEDTFATAGSRWAGELFLLLVQGTVLDPTFKSYGAAIDDMVLEWQETHPVAQTGAACSTQAGKPPYSGQCANMVLGVSLSTGTGDTAVPVAVVDPVETGNIGECTVDGEPGIQIVAYTSADREGETICLKRKVTGGNEFVGTIKVTTRINRAHDGYVFASASGNEMPTVYVRYTDKNDGAHGWDNGPDGKPGLANFDDDGDGTIDNAEEHCPNVLKSPHLPGTKVRFSDDNCGCPDNPVADSVSTPYDTADVVVADVFVQDGINGQGRGDGDGFADPGETVVIDVALRNLATFPLDNVELQITSDSPLVECLIKDRIRLNTVLQKAGDIGSEYNTASGSEHFSFVVARTPTRGSATEDFGSRWNVTLHGLAKAGPNSLFGGQTLRVDVPIDGTDILQTFNIQHNLNGPTGGVTRAVDFFDNMESYTNDQAAMRNTADPVGAAKYVKRVTGDDPKELTGTRCQFNNPYNPFSNNTSPTEFCELGEGYDTRVNYWHLNSNKTATGGKSVCNQVNGKCPDGGRGKSGVQSLASGMITTNSTKPNERDGYTSILNRMYWLETENSYQLGVQQKLNGDTTNNRPLVCNTAPCAEQAPVFEYWTQMSLFDWRLISGNAVRAWDAGLTYICVDKNKNNACDTKEDGNLDGSEKWEPIRSYYSPENMFRVPNSINCMYDPSDDGNNENDLWPGSERSGPSSTCFPNAVMTCVGKVLESRGNLDRISTTRLCFPETGLESEAVPGNAGRGKWIKKLFNLKPYRGNRVLFRWHVSPGSMQGIGDLSAYQLTDQEDGWWIDDVRVYGMANDFSLAVDNTGVSGNDCPSTPPVPTLTPKLAVLPYPRSQEGFPLPALACTDTTLAACDFNQDSTVDATSNIAKSSSMAPGRPYILDGSLSTSASCFRGALEYRFLQGSTVLREWQTDPLFYVTPIVNTTYTLAVRCSSYITTPPTEATANVEIWVTNAPQPHDIIPTITEMTKTSMTWTSPEGTNFQVARGDAASLPGSFAGAACLAPDTTAKTLAIPDNPANGQGYWYLVRVKTNTWNDGTQTVNRNDTLTICP